MQVRDVSVPAILTQRFEGHQALYLDRGVLLVEVGPIRRHSPESFEVRVTEIPVPGLRDNLFVSQVGNGNVTRESGRLTWVIKAGAASIYNQTTWLMGYGGWSMYFDPALLEHFRSCAGEWASAGISPTDCYSKACKLVMEWKRSADTMSPVFLRRTLR